VRIILLCILMLDFKIVEAEISPTIQKELAINEWLPSVNRFLANKIFYSPICRSDTNSSQMKVRLLKDTRFLFSNLKAGDVLIGVASFYQGNNYTTHSMAFCKPIFGGNLKGQEIESCLYDFNNDGVFDDRSDMAYRVTKAPEEDFTLSKHQYPYEVIDYEGAVEAPTQCVTINDSTWTSQSKPKQLEKAAKLDGELAASNAVRDLARKKGVVSCVGERECKKIFQLTQIFISEHSDMKIQVSTDSLIETYNPTETNKIGIKATKYPSKGDNERVVLEVYCKSVAPTLTCLNKEIDIYNQYQPFLEKLLSN